MSSPDAASLYAAAGSSATLLDGIFKTEAVGQILLMVNLTILAAGTFWLMWNILAGITQSAWDGEFLGKRFHTLWMPIRNAIGIAMLIPAFGGWGAAQLILYQAAKMGAGAANIAVANGAGAFTAPKASDFHMTSANNYAPQVQAIYGHLLCRENKRIESQALARPENETGMSAQDWENSTFMNMEGCGTLTPAPAGKLQDAQNSAANAAKASLQPLAARVAAARVQGPAVSSADVSRALRDAVTLYKQAVETAANAMKDTEIPQSMANSHGDWLGFGYRTYGAIRVASDINAATGSTATVSGNRDQSSASAEASAAGSYHGEFDLAVTGATTPSETSSTSLSFSDIWEIIKNSPSAILRFMFGSAKISDLKATLSGQGGDLIVALQGAGTLMIGIGVSAVLVIFGVVGALGLIGALSGITLPTAMWLTGLALIILTPLLGMGITLAAYLPLVPAIFWTLAIVGWLLTVAEALFMAPLWAFIHLETEGEGMGQKTEKGYAFIMNLVLRPLVLVFTFTIASMVLNAAWAMLGSHIADAISAVDLFSFSGLFIFLGLCFALVTTAMALVYKVYGTAIGLADAIPAWLGTNFHNYSSQWGEGDGGGGAGGRIGQGMSSRLERAQKPVQSSGADKVGAAPKVKAEGF